MTKKPIYGPNGFPLPSCGLVYFMDMPSKKAIRIGWTGNEKETRIDDHLSNGMDFIAAMPGTGGGLGTVEKSLHNFYQKYKIKVRNSDSCYDAAIVRPYVDSLIHLHYAFADMEWAKCCSQLPWKILNPDAVLKQLDPVLNIIHKKTIDEMRDDWQTPLPVIEAARYALGGKIDLDPASSPEANVKRVGAAHWFDHVSNGLNFSWWGTVFMNPPYSTMLLRKFIMKLWNEYKCGNVHAAITVTNLQSLNSLSSGKILQQHATIHAILDGRIKFIPPYRLNPNTNNPISMGSPTHGTICSYFGKHPELFMEAFEKIGDITIFPKKGNRKWQL